MAGRSLRWGLHGGAVVPANHPDVEDGFHVPRYDVLDAGLEEEGRKEGRKLCFSQ